MDPNANLDEQLRLVRRIQELGALAAVGAISVLEQSELQAASERLADLVEALDHWITGGGFLPRRWQDALIDKAFEARRQR